MVFAYLGNSQFSLEYKTKNEILSQNLKNFWKNLCDLLGSLNFRLANDL